MFKTCDHDQEVGTNCIDCIMEKATERPRRLYYHIFDGNDPEEETAGILEQSRDVKDLFGKATAELAEHFFSGKVDNLYLERKAGAKRLRLSDVP